jgi:hypothetical protein
MQVFPVAARPGCYLPQWPGLFRAFNLLVELTCF